MADYLRRHHLGLIAIFIALSGTAVAAFDPVGSDGDVDACFNKKKQLSLSKSGTCKKGSKPVSWSVAGPPGAAGSTGPAGSQGATGADGAPGTARAYGLVQPNGLLTSSKGATVVVNGALGVFCVSVPGADPSTTPILLTSDYSGSSNGVATINTTIGGNPSSYPVAAWDPVSDTCSANQYEVQTGRQEIDSNSEEISVFQNEHMGFAFLVP